MPEISLSLALVLLLVLGAEFVNGWTDAPNSIATVVSTRVLSPLQAVTMASVLNMVGALVTGTAVAATIGKGIIRPEAIDLSVVAGAMTSIIIWSTVAWRFGLPTSESHALIAGLSGAGLATGGLPVLQWAGWQKVLMGLGFSTFLGLFIGGGVMTAIYFTFRGTRRATANRLFGRLQILSAAFMSFSHGSNDGQKFMGAFSLALLLGGVFSEFHVPLWVVLLCGTVMGVGTMVGGWRIVHTMGFKITKLEPANGFAAESSASFAILLASRLGIPLSTTHTISTSIIGVGASRRLSAVRWGVTRQIVLAWILTFPISAALGALLAWGFRYIL